MKACIIGSGITGLTAALLLAKQGHEVEIFEAGPRPAPLLSGFRREGLLFDTGFHYGGGIAEGGVLRQWLEALGVAEHLEFYEEGGERFFFEDGTEAELYAGQALLPCVEKQFPGAGLTLQNLIHECDEVLSLSPYTNGQLHEAPSLHLGHQDSTLDHIQATDLPQRLKAMLMARCLLYGTMPSQSAWEHFALVSGPYFHSCGSWKGGGETLVKVLLRLLRQYNVRVQCRSRVQHIEGQKGQGVTAVLLENGKRVPCDACYFTGHPQQLQTMLPQGLLRPAFYTHVEDIPETHSVLMLFAETTAFAPGQSIYVLNKEHEESPDTMFCTTGQGSGLYMCTGHDSRKHSETATETANEDGSVPLIALRFLPAGQAVQAQDYAAYKAQAVQEFITLAEQRCPQLRGKWRVLDAATERTMRHWVVGSTGSLYGMQHRLQDMPLLSVTRLPGLFLAGQNILLPGVLGGIISAALAVGFTLGHDTVLEEFRACAHV